MCMEKELEQWLMRYRTALYSVASKLGDRIVEVWRNTARNRQIGLHNWALTTTGRYEKSLTHALVVQGNEVRVIVFPTVGYAEELEHGTSNVSFADIKKWADIKSAVVGEEINPAAVFEAIKKRGSTLPTPISDYVGERVEQMDFEAFIELVLQQAGLL